MGTIAKISVALIAKTSAFRKGMSKAGRSARGFLGPAGKAAKMITGIGIAAAAVAVGGLAILTSKQFEAGDALAKMSDRIGLATNRLAGLHLAAQLGGNSIKEMDKGLLRMVKSIGDADRGLKTQSDAFDELGVSIEDLKKLDADEQFALISDSIMALPSQVDRVNAAFNIFGKTGVGLLSTMKAGAEGMEEAQRKAEAFGLALNRTDAAKMEMAVDAMHEAKQVVVGLARQIALKLAPIITASATKFVEWATAGEGAAGLVEKGMGAVKVIVATVANAIQTATANWLRMRIAILESREALEGFWKDPRELAELNRDIGKLERQLEAISESDWGMNAINTMDAIAEGAQTAAEGIAEAATEMRGFDSDAIAALDAAEAHAEAMKEMERLAAKIFDQTRTPMEKYESTIDDLNKVLEANLIDFETFSRGVQMARADLESSVGKEPEAQAKEANFRQGRLSRLALNGTPGSRGRPAKVEDPQLKATNGFLASIDRTIKAGSAARAG